MDLVKRLEKRAKELDHRLKHGIYNQHDYEDRDLMEKAAKHIRKLESKK